MVSVRSDSEGGGCVASLSSVWFGLVTLDSYSDGLSRRGSGTRVWLGGCGGERVSGGYKELRERREGTVTRQRINCQE